MPVMCIIASILMLKSYLVRCGQVLGEWTGADDINGQVPSDNRSEVTVSPHSTILASCDLERKHTPKLSEGTEIRLALELERYRDISHSAKAGDKDGISALQVCHADDTDNWCNELMESSENGEAIPQQVHDIDDTDEWYEEQESSDQEEITPQQVYDVDETDDWDAYI